MREHWEMRQQSSASMLDLPEGVKLEIRAKQIRVTRPRGVLTGDFEHLNLDFQLVGEGCKLQVDACFGTCKTMAAIRTAISHVNNLNTGVSKGYRLKMRFVYAHFPMNASIGTNKDNSEIKNFLGKKKVRQVEMLQGVTVTRSELDVDGKDIERVCRYCAFINQKCHVKNKDIRKYLDGIYVSDKGTIDATSLCVQL